jgi:hypothetical protein
MPVPFFCVGTDLDTSQIRSPTKLLTDCKVNGVENPADAQSCTTHFDKGEKFHRAADNTDLSLLDGPAKPQRWMLRFAI